MSKQHKQSNLIDILKKPIVFIPLSGLIPPFGAWVPVVLLAWLAWWAIHPKPKVK